MRFPDVEALLIDYVESRLDVPVVQMVPHPRPEKFVRLWRNGGPARNRIVDRPLITVEGWAADDREAARITENARGLLFACGGFIPTVRNVTEIAGPYFIPDPDSGIPRFRFTHQITVRAKRQLNTIEPSASA
jgi:hypothetical protein